MTGSYLRLPHAKMTHTFEPLQTRVRQVVEDAIARHLHIFHPTETGPLGRPKVLHPVRVECGQVVLRNSDCGARDVFWTLDRWVDVAGDRGQNLLRKVGMWEFTNVNDLAADAIEHAHRSPTSAGIHVQNLEDRCTNLTALLGDWVRENGCSCCTTHKGECLTCRTNDALRG